MACRAKDFIHNLGDSIAEAMEEHSHRVDLNNRDDLNTICMLGKICKEYHYMCEFVRNYCDHIDGTLYHQDGVDGITPFSRIKL